MSSSSNVLLLVESEARSGTWNMATDEALLESARLSGLTAVRFYRWNVPTLSLGYFQKQWPEDLPVELARVRRLSGGGAILHHHEWTYSCVLPPGHPIAEEPVKLYGLVHEAIVELLNEQDIPAALRGSNINKLAEPFLCFGRQDPRDIVLGPHKIVGSAQRRRKGAVLQHGSLLHKHSPFATIYPGLCELTGREIPLSDWIPDLARRIADRLGITDGDPITSDLPLPIREMAQALEREKYRPAL